MDNGEVASFLLNILAKSFFVDGCGGRSGGGSGGARVKLMVGLSE